MPGADGLLGTADDLLSSNDNPGLLLAQGLFYPAPDGISYERNVDPTSGRPRFAGNQVVDSCGTNDAFENNPADTAGMVDSVEGVGTAARSRGTP